MPKSGFAGGGRLPVAVLTRMYLASAGLYYQFANSLIDQSNSISESHSRNTMRRFPAFVALLLLIGSVAAQEKSVNPGINKQFENPKVGEFIGRFERDGRDPYDHRHEVVKAIGLKPGM